jgi:hypothetical protein
MNMNFKHKINNYELWPGFTSSDHLNELNDIADNAFNKDSIEGYLAALLIYHQLCEEMAKVLIEDSRFFIKASIYPLEIEFSKSKRIMFGGVIEQLKETVSFDNKELFIQKCQNFNQVKNSLAHGLTKKTSIDSVKQELESIKEVFDEIFVLFDQAHDWFYLCFKGFKQDKFIDLHDE